MGSGISSTPIVGSVSPSSGAAGDTVTIFGGNFDAVPGNNEICFATAGASAFAGSPDSLVAEVPVGAVTGRVKVTKNYLEAYSPNPFTVTSACAAAKGDMNASGGLSPADVVLMLNCVFLASGSCDLCFADVNCSGGLSPADVVIELNMVFLGASPPC
ncbi:MAG: IPT/TIG domain-containing protein [candidate division Zixibacteria bacterium]|nr:IPT/TIG domain-containing protein [candidate division Zixibacteria bacterium]